MEIKGNESIKVLLEAYGTTTAPITQGFYQALCLRAAGDIERLQAENKRLRELITELINQHQTAETRMRKALKEQGFNIDPAQGGPDIRD